MLVLLLMMLLHLHLLLLLILMLMFLLLLLHLHLHEVRHARHHVGLRRRWARRRSRRPSGVVAGRLRRDLPRLAVARSWRHPVRPTHLHHRSSMLHHLPRWVLRVSSGRLGAA